MKYSGAALVVVAALALLPACRTTSPSGEPSRYFPPPLVQFEPAYYRTQLRIEEARYPDLFSPDSQALWVNREVAAVKWDRAIADGERVDTLLSSDAVTVTEEFIIIECHLESAFGDMSVAYDAVGLRNIAPFLELPNGRRIDPVQQMFQGGLEETPVGALKRFRRTIVLVFPKRDLWIHQPTLAEGASSIKLVLASAHGRFAFEWDALPAGETPPGLTAEEAVFAARVGFHDLYGSLRRLARLFQ